jgi:dTDP-4-dehydrorhamnose reductase
MKPCAESARNGIDQLKGKIDVVVNLAGVVDFDPPVNESFETNVYGTQHLIELVQLLNTRLVHVSDLLRRRQAERKSSGRH